MDYNAHNREVEAVWKSMEENKPIRMPMITGVSDRFFMYHPETNPKHISFEEYSTNPRVMFELQAGFDRYRRLYIPGDHRMGYPQPEEKGWSVNVDFQNYYEAVWLGGKLTFIDGQVPYAEPILNEDNKEMLFEKGIPDPFSGLMGKGKEYYELFQEYKKDFILDGYPVENIGLPFLGTDGPFTIACELMGPAQMCVQLYEDPDFAHQLLNYITDANIERQKAWRRYLGFPENSAVRILRMTVVCCYQWIVIRNLFFLITENMWRHCLRLTNRVWYICAEMPQDIMKRFTKS